MITVCVGGEPGTCGDHPESADHGLTPEEGMRAHLDLQGGAAAGVMLPIHWGTFNLAPHPWAEPGEWTRDAAEETRSDDLDLAGER